MMDHPFTRVFFLFNSLGFSTLIRDLFRKKKSKLTLCIYSKNRLLYIYAFIVLRKVFVPYFLFKKYLGPPIVSLLSIKSILTLSVKIDRKWINEIKANYSLGRHFLPIIYQIVISPYYVISGKSLSCIVSKSHVSCHLR